ncbi:MAG: phosphatase PAP2 family protein [Thermodesulfobacteriota bacterium]|nr:phosphatase PAP2 family protein [Thermodesulfobacteriota bacterium]
MSSFLSSWDIALFHLINGQGYNYFLDWFMPFMTDLKNFSYVLLVLAVWVLYKEKKAGIVFLIFIGLTLAITDQFSSRLLKEWLGRVRPCHVLDGVRMLTDCNTSYSFPSSHAVNIFAAAFFLSQPVKKLSLLFFGIAIIVGYSRIYIGIHYPFDVIGGAGIGLLIAWPMRRLKDQVVARLIKSSDGEVGKKNKKMMIS